MANIDASQVVWDDAPSGQIDPSQVQWDDSPVAAPQTPMPTSMFGQPDTVSALNPAQRAAVSLPKEDPGKLVLLQQMGFEDVSQDEQGQIFVNGKPMKGTSFWQDLGGKLGDMVGPAMSIGGQVAGGIAALPAAAAAGPGALPVEMAAAGAGGMVGDIARQGALNMIQPEAGFDTGQTLTEGAIGASGPVIGKVAGKILEPVMKPLAAQMTKAMKAWGESFPNFLQLQTNIPIDVSKHVMDRQLKDGVSITAKAFKAPLQSDIAMRTLFGMPQGSVIPELDTSRAKLIAEQAERLGKAAVPVFQDYMKLEPEATQWILDRGAKNIVQDDKLRQNYILELASRVRTGLSKSVNQAGKDVREARFGLFKDNGGNVSRTAKVSLTDVNQNLATELEQEGLLKKVGDGYQINPEYASLRTGKAQSEVFQKFIQKFFKEAETEGVIGESELTRLPLKVQQAIINAQTGAATREEKVLADQFVKSARPQKIWKAENSMNFDEFVGKLNQMDNQISDAEFDRIGKMSPNLARYLGGTLDEKGTTYQGLRGKVINIAKAAGDTRLPVANEKYALLSGIKKGIGGIDNNDLTNIEAFFRSLGTANPLNSRELVAESLDKQLAKTGHQFLDDLKDYQVAQKLKGVSGIDSVNSLNSDFDRIFLPNRAQVSNALESADRLVKDPQMKFFTEAKDSKAAEWVGKKATNLMRMSMASRWYPFNKAGGAVGSAAGLGAGYATVSPSIAGRKELEFATSKVGQGIYKAGIRAEEILPKLLGMTVSHPVTETAVSRTGAAALGDLIKHKKETTSSRP